MEGNREMREILFRGKDKDDGKWYEGYYMQLHDTTYCCMPSDNADEANRLNKENEHHYIVFEQMTDWGLPNKHLRAEVLPETVCQYTGLKDREGRKIFEGDIITYQHDNDDCPFPNKDTKRRVGRVYFQEFRSCFTVAEGRNGSDIINQDLFKYVQNGNRVEVIGNIFDNPELIGE